MLARLVVAAFAVLSIVAACNGDKVGSTASSTQAVTASHLDGPLDVAVQLGGYQLGDNIDGFVWGPEIVVYGDGSVFAELSAGIRDGVAIHRLVEGQMGQKDLQRLRDQAALLPSASPVGMAAVDASPLVLAVGSQTWQINDLTVEPFAAYVDELRSTVEARATESWQPTRWVQRPAGEAACTAVDRSTTEPFFDAPVYPHVLDQYMLGQFAC